jgi:hypothetical protein
MAKKRGVFNEATDDPILDLVVQGGVNDDHLKAGRGNDALLGRRK